jgi:hypothetical protein
MDIPNPSLLNLRLNAASVLVGRRIDGQWVADVVGKVGSMCMDDKIK